MNTKQKIVTGLVSHYRQLPFKPINSLLRNLDYKFLKSDIQNRTVIKNVDGINYELDLTAAIDSGTYFNYNKEPRTSNALKRLCKPGMIVFDIGANLGSHTLPIAKSIGSEGKVYAFEPVPWALDKLKKNLSLNSFKNVLIQPVALSDYVDENAEFSLRASFKTTSETPVNNDGSLNHNWWHASEKVKVRVETLDNFVACENIKKLDVIKLDVDGFEVKVFKGAEETLSNLKPIILLELAPSWLKEKGDNVEDIINILRKNEYTFYDEITFNQIPNINSLVGEIRPESGVNVIASAKLLS